MSDFSNAFDVSPVPAPGPDAVAPELFRGIYGMPMFVTIPTADIPASVDFWTRGLGFFELFAIPGQLVHLRRWAFQDVLLVPAASVDQAPTAMSASFACVLGQVDDIADAVRAVDAGAMTGPRDTAWNTRDIEVLTPENVRVVFTAAKPFDPTSEETAALRAVGIGVEGGDNGEHV
ncbi:VOC family protein [Microbacterium binotii]|uniref:VOC family protein n=1 Tax=Microbacterium binotii TaxID=462710 RepID=UPI001F43D2E6|nr:VOC family protein [Microbacterium binotii]UIN30432.1 VOC family protein [Microbacterium binotii]